MAERLTDRGITALKPSDKKQFHFDSEVSGLVLKVNPTGRKVFIFDWRDSNGKQRRATIDSFRLGPIGKARVHARPHAAQGRYWRGRHAGTGRRASPTSSRSGKRPSG